jgi:hypothetical protein
MILLLPAVTESRQQAGVRSLHGLGHKTNGCDPRKISVLSISISRFLRPGYEL